LKQNPFSAILKEGEENTNVMEQGRHQQRFLYRQDGRSMVEMIGVLFIVGFLTFGGIYGYVRASQVLRTNRLKDEITTMIANIRSMYFSLDNYSSLNVATMIGAGFVPDKYLSTDKKSIINPLKGSVLVGTGKTELSDTGAFILIFNGLDSETCRDITAVSWGSDMSTGFLAMTIKNDGDLTVEDSKLVPINITTQPPTFLAIDMHDRLLSDVAESCNCTSLYSCAIAWKYL
jgi:hypothetical protein